MRDGDQAITGALAFLVDIDREKRAEAALRRLNEELEQRVALAVAERLKAEANLHQAQKIEAIGLLTGGVAHDFNNLLTAILGNLELVEMRLGDDRLRRPIEAAIRSAERGARLIEQLLAFSRRQHLTPQPVDLNAAVAGMSEMLKRTLGGTIDVRTELAPDAWAALIDPTQLELALLNLAINARDAMPLGGSLVIETRNVPANAAGRPDDVVPGDYVTVAVSDTGEGMTDDVLAHAFEPFFTTKEVGKGSGLGLSQVYGLVKQSGGGVALTSQRGRGTTVSLFLPRALAAGAASVPEPTDAAPRRGRGRVLVVDDQDDVRDVAVAYLETLGYDTAEAASGRAALALIDGGLAIDLALVDYAMPGMTGLELMRALETVMPISRRTTRVWPGYACSRSRSASRRWRRRSTTLCAAPPNARPTSCRCARADRDRLTRVGRASGNFTPLSPRIRHPLDSTALRSRPANCVLAASCSEIRSWRPAHGGRSTASSTPSLVTSPTPGRARVGC